MLDDEDEDELFELALAYFKLNAVHVSDPEVEPSPWAEEQHPIAESGWTG